MAAQQELTASKEALDTPLELHKTATWRGNHGHFGRPTSLSHFHNLLPPASRNKLRLEMGSQGTNGVAAMNARIFDKLLATAWPAFTETMKSAITPSKNPTNTPIDTLEDAANCIFNLYWYLSQRLLTLPSQHECLRKSVAINCTSVLCWPENLEQDPPDPDVPELYRLFEGGEPRPSWGCNWRSLIILDNCIPEHLPWTTYKPLDILAAVVVTKPCVSRCRELAESISPWSLGLGLARRNSTPSAERTRIMRAASNAKGPLSTIESVEDTSTLQASDTRPLDVSGYQVDEPGDFDTTDDDFYPSEIAAISLMMAHQLRYDVRIWEGIAAGVLDRELHRDFLITGDITAVVINHTTTEIRVVGATMLYNSWRPETVHASVPSIVFEVLDRLALDDVKGAVRWMLFRTFYRQPLPSRRREVERGSDETDQSKESKEYGSSKESAASDLAEKVTHPDTVQICGDDCEGC